MGSIARGGHIASVLGVQEELQPTQGCQSAPDFRSCHVSLCPSTWAAFLCVQNKELERRARVNIANELLRRHPLDSAQLAAEHTKDLQAIALREKNQLVRCTPLRI